MLPPPPTEVWEAALICLEGEFDLSERDRLLDGFGTVQNAPVVIVDFQKASYIDSVVLECLVALHAAIQKRDGRLVLLNVRGAVLRLLEVTSLDRLFDIRSSFNNMPADRAQVRKLTIEARTLS